MFKKLYSGAWFVGFFVSIVAYLIIAKNRNHELDGDGETVNIKI